MNESLGKNVYFLDRKDIFIIFFCIFYNFLKIKSYFLKKIQFYTTDYTAKFYYRIRFFGNFPQTLGMLGFMENCETTQKLHEVVCEIGSIYFLGRKKYEKFLTNKNAFSLMFTNSKTLTGHTMRNLTSCGFRKCGSF